MFKAITLSLLILLSGCSTTTTNKQTPKTISQTDLNLNTGILTGTFSRQKNGISYPFISIKFKNIETNETYSIEKSTLTGGLVSLLQAKPNFSDTTVEGDPFAFKLPAGKYSIYNFKLIFGDGFSTEEWTSKKHFSIPFEVFGNQVNYLGNLNFIGSYGKDIFGLDIYKGGYWILSDKIERDKSYISAKYSSMPIKNIVSVMPTEKEIYTPIILFPSEIKELTEKSNKQ